jgi:hypothetical protein
VKASAATGDARQTRQPAADRAAWLTPVNMVVAALTLLALGLRLFYLTRPGYLLGVTEYDDGSYFGSAVRLVHGMLPYRDFVFVQPPGITLLMTPVALLARVTGTDWGLGLARIITMLAGAAGVALAGLLVRHRGVTRRAARLRGSGDLPGQRCLRPHAARRAMAGAVLPGRGRGGVRR